MLQVNGQVANVESSCVFERILDRLLWGLLPVLSANIFRPIMLALLVLRIAWSLAI